MMTLDAKTRWRLLFVATLAAPALTVQGVRLLADSELKAARAAAPAMTPAAPAEPPAPPETPLTARQSFALRWVVESAPKTPRRSPMERREAAPVQPVRTAPTAPKPDPVDDRPTNLRLTGMLTRQTESLAAIDGELRRIGDTVAPGWQISAIDTRHRFVMLRHTDGREFRIDLPGAENERHRRPPSPGR